MPVVRRDRSERAVRLPDGPASPAETPLTLELDPPLLHYRRGLLRRDGALTVATHRGSVFVRGDGSWERIRDLPVPGYLTGRYTPVTRIETRR